MKRVSEKAVECACNRLNNLLLGRRKNLTHIVLGYRYGYVCIEEQEDGETSIVRTIKAGMTKRQAYDYLCAMIEGAAMCEKVRGE